MENFPIPAPAFNGVGRSVEVGNVFDWLRQGWGFFVVNPGTWLAMMLLLVVVYLGLAVVPLVGPLAAHLLTPVLVAGMLSACRRVADEQVLEIGDLFAGFRQNTTALVMLGLLYMLGVFAASLVVLVLAGGSVAGGLLSGHAIGVGMAFGGVLVAGVLWLLLSVPLMMAFWFAPALVYFNAVPPAEALKASFHACTRNVAAFLVFGLIGMVLGFFAALPVGLGFLVLGPVFAGAMYASYRDVFTNA